VERRDHQPNRGDWGRALCARRAAGPPDWFHHGSFGGLTAGGATGQSSAGRMWRRTAGSCGFSRPNLRWRNASPSGWLIAVLLAREQLPREDRVPSRRAIQAVVRPAGSVCPSGFVRGAWVV